MELLGLILQSRELIKIVYAALIIFICAIITFKSNKIFRLSEYTGIRYFRNAFFFYGLAFLFRYFLKFALLDLSISFSITLSNLFFEFFIIMAGFFLLYSLLWKKIENPHEHHVSSLFNVKIMIFYLITILVVSLDYLWQTYAFLFISQIVLFTLLFSLSFINYREKGQNRRFLKFYSFAMFLALIAWILNAFAAVWFNWNIIAVIIIYSLNIIMFLIFLYGIINVTGSK